MTEIFFNAINFIKLSLNAEGVFAVSFCALSALFLLGLALSIFKRGYGVKNRVWFLLGVFGISKIAQAILEICVLNSLYANLILGIGIIYCVPLVAIREKPIANTKQRELARFIDREVKKRLTEGDKIEACDITVPTLESKEKPSNNQLSNLSELQPTAVKISPIKNQATSEEKEVCDLDFTHVKNVIERLEYYPLSASDKRQVKELEGAVIKAQSGEYNPQMKNRINDGLGALLKIMSKYGV